MNHQDNELYRARRKHVLEVLKQLNISVQDDNWASVFELAQELAQLAYDLDR